MFSQAASWFLNSNPKDVMEDHNLEIPGKFPDVDQSQHHHDDVHELAGSYPPLAPQAFLTKPFDPATEFRRDEISDHRSCPAVPKPDAHSPTIEVPLERERRIGSSRRNSARNPTQNTTLRAPNPSSTPSESVIAVFGMTGTGKTSFINRLTGSELKVGHNLQSMTSDIQTIECKIRDVTVTLVDTPGFDDTTRTDTEILTQIASWLKYSYDENTKLTGVIYLHRISDNRMSGSSYRNLDMFRSLCGMKVLSNVILATTMWDKVTSEEGNTREQDLLDEATFWGSMKASGALVRRYEGTQDSALRLVDELLRKPPITLKIQHELSVENKALIDTAAGKSIGARLEKMAADHKEELRMVKKHFELAMKEKDAKWLSKLEESQKKLEKKIAEAGKDKEKLHRPVNTRYWFQRSYRCLRCDRKTHKARNVHWPVDGKCPYCGYPQLFD